MLIPRILTALVLVFIVVGGVFYASDSVWSSGVFVLAVLALWEWAKLAECRALWLKILFTAVSAVLIYLLSPFINGYAYLLVTIVVMLAVLSVVVRYQRTQGRVGLNSRPLMLLLSFALTLVFIVALLALHSSVAPAILLLSMAIVWAMDTGAYFSGRAFGKRKLASYVSPGKSWEGVWGGALSAFILSYAVLSFVLSDTPFTERVWISVALTLIALLSVFGDLFESVLKRQADIKDSGSILPGHGGVLDRIDSLLVAMPLTYLLWSVYTV
ncbi:phosphatidate cytidylyltransferase [Thiomicrorhabdus xiamenensis]|uniref:Phosphatidate cytidylyltransferase n=1 Tax=Thiomicrorhabdus xiamenensis TaxID=2739063 RepID=A0A7D4P4X9_9GAMM|nr:phosphatidate cytidylyltransferase [Thiomicrorhabdus xiamenensis]QKI89235.1 phosphatidate cytidylyltransferase [Thiomicrorhabdus xiamenensis]